MFSSFFGKIYNSLSVIFAPTLISNKDPPDTTTNLPDDVLEGHFVVIANKGEETKRFIVELHYLTHPAFLVLLERAKEEYGFRQKGVLLIPCHPQELEKILEEPRDVRDGSKLTDSS
ncbi:auxin-responsive protein SAUR71-like [Cajanus cajan]|uniref:auxin-responsive protein SAUR71-like n=1 Tax=Cajanus cajan TaxID=3821 RepID=UPI00098DA426|nr:auxin-responsive protein SAUR71-like [Cajanus cajan]